MATRLWTPEDLGIKPVYWIRAEDQEPDFYNIITRLVDVNGDIDFFVDTSKPTNGLIKKNENERIFLTTGLVKDNCPMPATTLKLNGSFVGFNCKKSYDLLKKSEVSVCLCAKSTYQYYNTIYKTGTGNHYSYPMFYITIRQDVVSLTVYPKGSSSGRTNKDFNVNCQNGVIACSGCSYSSEKLSLRCNGVSSADVSFVTDEHQYPYNDTNFRTDIFGGYWNEGVFFNELIVYDAVLEQSAYEKIEGYLAWKNNYVELLPSDHPYKESPPEVEIPEPEPEGVSFLRIRSDVILDMAVQNRFGDVNIDVGSIPLRMLPLPKDSFTGETVTGHYSVYGNPKYILVPKGQVQMPLSLLFTPNNLKVYSITPCSTTLRFN